MGKITIETIFYPGYTYSDKELNQLTIELKQIAKTCFDEVPQYQALTGERDEFKRVILAMARNERGELLGFCSSLLLEIPVYGNVLHLGLTCVSPKARGKKLTHKLASKLLMQFLLKESPLSSTWISNCACVLSSLGNVALYFEDIYPSPYGVKEPTKDHIKIAKFISQKYRNPIAINHEALFNPTTFVFEGSVKDAVFEKEENDARYYHRNRKLTDFYKDILNFENGDEVLQIGKVSLLTFPKYLWSTSKRKSNFFISNLSEKLS